MEALPSQLLSAVPHVVFGIFDFALPNLVAWGLVDIALLAAAWLRLPRWLEATEEGEP